MQDNKQLVVLDFWWSMKTVRGHSQHGFRPRQANSGSVPQQDDGIDLDLGKVRFQVDKVESSKQRPRVLRVSEDGRSWEDPFKEGWSLREAREVVKPSQPQYFAPPFCCRGAASLACLAEPQPLVAHAHRSQQTHRGETRGSHSRHSRRTIFIKSTGANFFWGEMVWMRVYGSVECCCWMFFLLLFLFLFLFLSLVVVAVGEIEEVMVIFGQSDRNHESCHSTDGAASEESRWVDILMTLCFSIFFPFMLALHSEPWVVKLRYSAACLAITYQAPTMQSFCERWDSFMKGTPQTSPRSR